MRLSRAVPAAICFFGTFVLAGCGSPKTGDVSGKITIKGKTPNIEGLTINFFSEDGRSVATAVELDGTYHAKRVPAGPVTIGLTPPPVASTPAPETVKPTRGGPVDPKAVAEYEKKEQEKLAKSKIADKLRDPATSGLTMTVVPNEENKFDHDIK